VPVIELHNVIKDFGSLRALDRVTAAVQPGDIVGLIGPNGSGKTTLLRLLSGLTHPTAGTIRVLGSTPADWRVRQRIGIVAADFPALGRQTAAETIRYVARLRARPDWGRAADLAGTLDLDLDRRVAHLSTGNHQKLGIVLALMHEPELILLDEPTTGLDPVAQRTFRQLIFAEQRRGATIVLSSHVLSSVRTLATHLLALNTGRVVAAGPVDSTMDATGRSVHVRFSGLENEAAELTELLVDAIVRSGEGFVDVHGAFRGDPNGLIDVLSGLDVVDFVMQEAKLEDLLMGLYEAEAR